MRTIIDLTPEQVAGLDRLRKRKNVSRAAAVREAVDLLLAGEPEGDLDEVFGSISADEATRLREIIAELHSEWERE